MTSLIVTVTEGILIGSKSTTESGFEYTQFLGIPYAKPPVGELRFKSPQPPEPWEGVRDATNNAASNIACQVDFRTGSVTGSEDCLYLNVYTPKLPTPESKLKPVMVMSHGGGFMSGNGTQKTESGPDYLIENDVVVVNINYRLGALGFLSLDIPEVAGNMGLKDHVKALQWVQNNIAKFGGDKNNVTIFGVSAGSAACEFLMLSPLAKGLFHKTILQSGSALNNWAINFPKKANAIANKLVQELGYTGPEDDIYAVHKALLEVSASQLTGIAMKISEKETSQRIFFGFVPVIEQDFGDGEAFITDTPYGILKSGKFNKVPVIRGFCNKEGSLTSMMKPTAVKDLIETKTFIDHFAYFLEECDIKMYNPKLVTAYVDNARPGGEAEEFAIDFFGDLTFAAGINLAAKLQCSKVPVYMYKFCYSGNLNVFKTMFGLLKDGAMHGDDVGYLLRHIILESKTPNETDLLVRNRMTKMWTNFAKTGYPTPDNCPELPVKWPLFTNSSQQYLNIDKEFTIESNYEPGKMLIFEQLTHKYERYKSIFRSGPILPDDQV